MLEFLPRLDRSRDIAGPNETILPPTLCRESSSGKQTIRRKRPTTGKWDRKRWAWSALPSFRFPDLSAPTPNASDLRRHVVPPKTTDLGSDFWRLADRRWRTGVRAEPDSPTLAYFKVSLFKFFFFFHFERSRGIRYWIRSVTIISATHN